MDLLPPLGEQGARRRRPVQLQQRGGGVLSDEAKKREVLQLLRDYRAFYSPFGGAASTDAELNLQAKGNYGPAGVIFAGTEFDKSDRMLLRQSFDALRAALARLQKSDFQAWASLVEPYLADPADASLVDEWRRKVDELDKENEIRAKRKPPQQPRVALVVPRMFLERHDRALEKLAEDLKHTDLYAVFARPMSEEEEKAGQDQNAEIAATVERLRATGSSVREALAQAAEMHRISVDMVERVYEFRSETKPDECIWDGCDRAPFSQNLCVAHYHQQRRAKKRSAAV